jgi:hypothetical protein
MSPIPSDGGMAGVRWGGEPSIPPGCDEMPRREEREMMGGEGRGGKGGVRGTSGKLIKEAN